MRRWNKLRKVPLLIFTSLYFFFFQTYENSKTLRQVFCPKTRINLEKSLLPKVKNIQRWSFDTYSTYSSRASKLSTSQGNGSLKGKEKFGRVPLFLLPLVLCMYTFGVTRRRILEGKLADSRGSMGQIREAKGRTVALGISRLWVPGSRGISQTVERLGETKIKASTFSSNFLCLSTVNRKFLNCRLYKRRKSKHIFLFF